MEKKWWHGKTAYQIYPKSFQDSNGDGTGDLRGIISRLDYLRDLGIDLLWLSPIYPSPFVDQGYDISDYCNIAPVFGTLDDFDELLSKARDRGIDLIMDLVLNHCSSEHPWFKKACADPLSPEADYFYIRKGRDGQPPDNLRSYFGGSVWSKLPGHEDEDLWYCHYFAREQPDLNWNNPQLREQIYSLVNFWIDRGVKGFRIDAILSIVKDLSFPGLPPDAAGDGMSHAANMNALLLDRIGPYLNELKERTFDRADCFTVGEVLTVTDKSVREFAGTNGYFSTMFDLSCRAVIESAPHYTQFTSLGPDEFASCVFATQELYQQAGAMTAPILDNHDEPRGVSYFMPEYLQNAQGARALATVQLTLRGIPFIYQGDELGMTNTHFASIDEFNDLYAHDEYRHALESGLSDEQALRCVAWHSRDNARTPMLWDDSASAGFTSGKPWLRLHQDWRTVNVKNQLDDENSVLNTYRRLTALRHDSRWHDVLAWGDFTRCPVGSGMIAFWRHDENCTLLTIVNTRQDVFTMDLTRAPGADLALSAPDHHCCDLIFAANGISLVNTVLTMGCGGAAVICLRQKAQA